MKKMLPLLLSFLFCLLQQLNTANAQCSLTNTISGTACTGQVLTASLNAIPAQLEWKLNGSTVKLLSPSWNPTAVTVAGGNGSGSGPDQFANTYAGILVDAAGNIYVSDGGNHRVQKWAPGATFGVTVAGSNGNGPDANQLNNPAGIFLDAFCNLYIADQNNNRVQKWAPGAGSGTTVAGGNGFGGALNQLEYPSYVSVDASGNVFVLDGWDNARVMKWAPDATEGEVVAGGNGQGNADNQINRGTGMVIDNAGNIYVTDWYANRVQEWTPGATTGITIVSGLYLPNGLILDGAGNFYVVKSTYVSPAYESHIVRFRIGDNTWQDIIPATYGSATNQLAGATNGYFDAAGNMYILDGANQRVQRFSTSAISQTYTTIFPGNYTATATSFSGCQTISNTINSVLSPVTASQAVSICTGSSSQLSVTGSSSYSWNPGNLSGSSISVNPISSTTYTVTDNATSCTSQILAFVPESSAPLISGTSCIDGTNLTGTVAKTPVTIEWKLNGTTVASSSASYSNNNMTVVAGGNGVGDNLNQTKSPSGMALDVAGNVYVAEEGNNRVTKWAPGDTQGVVVAGGNGIGFSPKQLNSPSGVFVDKFNNIYIADQYNQRIQKWAPGATEGVTVAGGNGEGSALNQLSNPLGVYVDDAANLYVPDRGNHRVVKWSPGSTQGIVVAGGNGQGSAANQLNNPLQLTFDQQSNIYIADYANHRIQKWAPGATSGTTVAGGNGSGFGSNQVGQPQGVTVDGAGNVYALSGYNSYITKWAPGATDGVYLAGYCCNPPGGVWGAYTLQADVNGNLYVADYVNCRVVKYNASLNIPAFNPTVAGEYTLAATQFNGCISCSPVHPVYASPLLTITGNQYFCAGNSTTLDAGTHSTYQWSTGATTQTETFSSEGNYTVTVTDNGCSSSKNFFVTAATLVVTTAANPAASCIGSPVQLTSSLISGGVQNITKVYYIDGNHLNAMPNSCSSNARYGYYFDGQTGFYFADSGIGMVTTIKVEFNIGALSAKNNPESIWINNSSGNGTFNAPYDDNCGINPANFMSVNLTTDGYVVGGTNTINLHNAYYLGLVPTSTLNNFYAKVTVNYQNQIVSYAWSPNGDTIANPIVNPFSTTTYTLTAFSLGCTSTSTVNVSVSTAPGDTTVFGDHVWNVYAFNSGGSSNTGHSWNEGYSGYYVDNSLNFNTQSNWSSGSSPSNAPGYFGCTVNNDNHSWSARRKGFPCGTYFIDVPSHDDEAQLFINGVKVWEHIGAGDSHSNVWTGFLDDNSTVVFRVTEGGGNSNGSITLTPQTAITVSGPVKFCPGYSVQLTAVSAGSYLWSTGETTQTISVNATGNYSVDMTTNGCTNTASQTITVAPLDTAIIYSNKSPGFNFCPSMGTIDLRTLFKPGITRTWSNGSHSTSIFPSVPGNYSLTISDALGCTATSHVTVTSGVAGVDSIFGNNAWKVNAYSQGYEYYYGYIYGRAWDSLDYSGYYLDTTLNFNSENKWNSDSNPSTAPGYQGCSINDDYVSWSAKRQGFSCGIYSIDILSHDDDAQLYVDGVNVWEHIGGCCDQHFSVWTGALNASSKVEFKIDEVDGNDVGALQFTLVGGNANFINVSGNPFVCTGQSYTLTSSILGTYQWFDGQTSNPAYAASSGSYGVTVTDASGCVLTADPVTVTILPAIAPVANITTSSSNVCDWNPVTLSSDSTGGNLWSNNETTQSISVSAVNLYTLKVTNNAGCFDESSIQIISGFTPPTPVATVSDTVCSGSSATLSVSGLAPGGQVASFNGINQYVVVSQDVPEYDFTVEMWLKTTASNTGIFSVTSGYLGVDGNDRNLYLSDGQLSARVYAGSAWNSGIQINDGHWHHIALTVQSGVGQKIYVDGNQSSVTNSYDHSDFDWQTDFNIGFSPDASSQYFNGQIDNVRIWSEARSQSDIRNNMLSETPSSATHLDYQSSLNGNLNATVGSNGTAPNGITYTGADFYSYAWTGTGAPAATNSETQNTTALTASGTYSVTASTGACNPSASASSNVVVLPSAEYYPDTDGDGFGDANSPMMLLCVVPVNGYSLNNDDCNDALAFVHPGTTDICNSIDDNCNGLTDENSITVTNVASAPTTFCSGASVNLTANASGAGSISYQWMNENAIIPGATTTAYTATAPGDYAIAITNGICSGTSNSIVVTVLTKPAATIAPSGSISACKDVTITFSANTGTGYVYQWYKGTAAVPAATEATYNANGVKKGFYSVLVTASNGCYNHSDSTELIRLNVPPSVINILNPAGNPDLCINQQVKLRGTGGQGFSYLWYKNNVSTGVTTRDYIAMVEGNYTVKITNSFGCNKTSVQVAVFSSCRGSIAAAVRPVMSVYPNPTDGHFAVSLTLFNSFNGNATVDVLNMLGQIVQSETVPVTDGVLFKELFIGKETAASTYLLRIVADGQVFNEQVVVQH